MAASSTDLRDILALPGPSAIPTPTPAPKKAPRAQKPEGISRELYSLIGNHAPSLAAVQQARAKFKQKPTFGRGKTHWEWRTFTNSARKDNLQLGHWEKVTVTRPATYEFANYNTSTNVYTYTDDEYVSLLEDKEWTKEETDYLFSLAKEYDTRWFVILDRYEYSGGPERALEDLKARYYSVCRKLIRSRPWSGDENARTTLLNTYQFDKGREKTRKMYVASLFARTPEQIAEEEALYLEIKKLEQKERRFAKEREELMRVVAGIESGLHIHQPDEEVISGLFVDPKKKKKKVDGTDAESPAPGPSTVQTKRNVSTKQAQADQLNCVTRLDMQPSAATSTKTPHVPAHLRSSKLPYPKTSIAPKVTAALAELGVNYTRLVMPTKDNIQRLESLLDATALMIDMKRAVDRIDQEIRTQKKLLGLIAGEENTTPTHGEVNPDTELVDQHNDEVVKEEAGQSRMDVDRESSAALVDGIAEDVQPQSQSHKRSLSISSVDTSATTASARVNRGNNNNKRPRKT